MVPSRASSLTSSRSSRVAHIAARLSPPADRLIYRGQVGLAGDQCPRQEQAGNALARSWAEQSQGAAAHLSGGGEGVALVHHQPVADGHPTAADVKASVTARKIIEDRPEIDGAGYQGIFRALARSDPLQANSATPRGFPQDFESRPAGPAIGPHYLVRCRLFVTHAKGAPVPIRLAACPY